MKTIGSKVLVKIKKKEELVEKINGLTIPLDPKSDTTETAEVLEVGEKVDQAVKGCEVYIPKSCGVEFKEGDNVLRVIDVNDIIVIL